MVIKFLRNWELWMALAFLALGFIAFLARGNYALLCMACFFNGLFVGKMVYAKDEVKFSAAYGYLPDEELGGDFDAARKR